MYVIAVNSSMSEGCSSCFWLWCQDESSSHRYGPQKSSCLQQKGDFEVITSIQIKFRWQLPKIDIISHVGNNEETLNNKDLFPKN